MPPQTSVAGPRLSPSRRSRARLSLNAFTCARRSPHRARAPASSARVPGAVAVAADAANVRCRRRGALPPCRRSRTRRRRRQRHRRRERRRAVRRATCACVASTTRPTAARAAAPSTSRSAAIGLRDARRAHAAPASQFAIARRAPSRPAGPTTRIVPRHERCRPTTTTATATRATTRPFSSPGVAALQQGDDRAARRRVRGRAVRALMRGCRGGMGHD